MTPIHIDQIVRLAFALGAQAANGSILDTNRNFLLAAERRDSLRKALCSALGESADQLGDIYEILVAELSEDFSHESVNAIKAVSADLYAVIQVSNPNH